MQNFEENLIPAQQPDPQVGDYNAAAKDAKVEKELTPEQQKGFNRTIFLLKQGLVSSFNREKEELDLPEEIIQSLEVKFAAKEGMIHQLRYGQIDMAFTIKEQFNLPEEIIESPEVQSAVKERIILQLIRPKGHRVVRKKPKFMPEEIVQPATEEDSVYRRRHDNVDQAIMLKEKFNLSEELAQSAAKEGIVFQLKNNNINQAIEIREVFNLPEEIVQSVGKDGVIFQLKNNNTDQAIEIQEKLNLSEEIIQSPEVQLTAKENLFSQLKGGNIDLAIRIKEKFNLSEEIVQSVVKDGIIFCIKNNCAIAFEITDRINLSEDIIKSPEVQSAAKEGMLCCLKRSEIDFAIEIKERFNLSEEFVRSSEVQSVAEREVLHLLKYGGINSVIKIIEKFNLSEDFVQSPEVQSGIRDGVPFCLREGDADLAVEAMEKFNLPEEFMQSAAENGMLFLLNSGNYVSANYIIEKFNLPEDFVKSPEVQSAAKNGMLDQLKDNNFNVALDIKNKFNLSEEFIEDCLVVQSLVIGGSCNPDNLEVFCNTFKFAENKYLDKAARDLEIFSDLFGAYGYQVPELYFDIKAIRTSTMPKEELDSLGISESGEKGIAELRRKLNDFRQKIVSPELDEQEITKHRIYEEYFKSYINFKESQWGGTNEESFKGIINNFAENKKSEIRVLPEGYDESGIVKIKNVDYEAQKAFKYSEQFQVRCDGFKKSIAGSLELFKENKPLSFLVGEAEKKRELVVAELKEKKEKITNPKALENISQRLDNLEKINLRSVKEFQKNFAILSEFKEFSEELSELIFFYTFHEHKGYLSGAEKISKKEGVSFEDSGWLVDFINHGVNQETWDKYFKDDHARKAFLKLINIRALEEEFSRAQNQETKGQTAFDFVPTRGLPMEFSGHIASACWASKYDSLAESFPNFSSIVMVKNRGTKNERLAGACMLIETDSVDDEPLLVVRGLNPNENTINSLSVEDFFNKFSEYVKKIAEKTGRKPAVVIDDYSGGSSTNRPVLFAHLEEVRKSLKKVELKSNEDTKFNGYDITNDVYLL